MKQQTRQASGYEETEPTSKSRLRPLLGYGIAVLAVGFALRLHFLLIPSLGEDSNGSFMLFFVVLKVASRSHGPI